MDYEYKVLRSKSGVLRYAARRPVFVLARTPDESVSIRVRGEGIDDIIAAAQMGNYALLGTRMEHGLFLDVVEAWYAKEAIAQARAIADAEKAADADKA